MSYDNFMTCVTTCLTTMFVNRAPGLQKKFYPNFYTSIATHVKMFQKQEHRKPNVISIHSMCNVDHRLHGSSALL